MKIGLDLDQVVYEQVAAQRDWMQYQYPHDDETDNNFDAPATRWFYYRDWLLDGEPMTDEDFAREITAAVEAGDMFGVGGMCDPDWRVAIDMWRREGHQVHLITDRSWGTKDKANTEQWLTDQHIRYDGLHFVKDKTIVACDVLIDDKPSNLIAWEATGRPVICWDQPWNQSDSIDGGYDGGAGRARTARGARSLVAELVYERDNAPVATVAPGPESVLQEAQRLVHGDRRESYGHPADDLTRTGRLWGAILELPEAVPAWQVALCMCAVKISREVNGQKRDNLVDLAGYAEVAHMTYDRVQRGEALAHAGMVT